MWRNSILSKGNKTLITYRCKFGFKFDFVFNNGSHIRIIYLLIMLWNFSIGGSFHVANESRNVEANI